MKRVRFLIAPMMALVLLGSIAVAQQPVPPRGVAPETLEYLQRAPDLRQARLRLMGLRDGGQLDQDQMMDLARWLDEDLRGGLMRQLGVVDAVVDGRPRPPNPERSGSAPSAGRGVFSDEDVLAKTPEQLERILRAARERGHTVSQNRFYAHIAELDTVVWKPGMRQAALSSPGAFLDEAVARALDRDFASGAKPGAIPHPLESVLENLTKGQKAFFERPLPADYDQLPETRRFPRRVDAELELAAGAKDVVRSLDATGLRERFPVEYERLDAFRRMRTSFADSGLGSFEEAQELMRRLMRAAYDGAENQLSDEIGALERGLRSPDEALRRRSMGLAQELQERLVRMAARFEVLSDLHPESMQRLSGRPPVGFWSDQVERVRRLDPLVDSAGAAERATARARVLSITVDALQFAQCLADGKSKTECVEEALAGYVIGELVSQGIGYVTLVSPTGGLIATAGLAGVALYASTVQVYDAYLEYAAYQEAREREAAAIASGAAARRARVPELASRVAAFEARVGAVSEASADRRAALLSELNSLEALRSLIEADSTGESQLESLAAGIDGALEPCFRLRDIAQRVEPYVLQAEQEAEEAEQFVRNAVDLATRCSSRADLGRAADAERRALRSREEISELEVLFGSDLDAARVAVAQMQAALDNDTRAHLGQSTGLIDAARRAAGRSRDYVDRLLRFPDTVDAANEEIESQRRALGVEYQMFVAAFPADLIALLEGSSTRLEGIGAAIEGIVGLQLSDWAERRADLMDASQTARAQMEAYAAIERRDLPFRIEHLQQCDAGGDFDAVMLIDRIDTAGTVADLAITLLGREYESRRSACLEQLAAPATPVAPVTPTISAGSRDPARVATPGSDDREALLAQIAEWQQRLDCLEEGVRKNPRMDLDCNGRFMIGARGIHIEELRRWIRKAQLQLGMSPASPPGAGGDSSGVRVGSLAAGMLLVEMVVGDVRYYFDSPEQGRPLAANAEIPSDATVQTGGNASATLRFPHGAQARIDASTRVRPTGLGGGEPPRLQLFEGSVEVVETGSGAAAPKKVAVALPAPASAASGARLRLGVTTPHLELSPVGTRYRVTTSSARTDVEVSEGVVSLRGSMLARGPDALGTQGKPSFTQSLELKTGERGFGIGVAPQTVPAPSVPVTPTWLSVPRPAAASGVGAVADPGPLANPGAGAAGQRGEVGAMAPPAADVPDWLSAGRDSGPAGPLDRADPWNDPQVQALMDEWLGRATPVTAATQMGPFRYSEWGQVIGPATVYAGTPDHPAGWTRHQALWVARDRYTSLNLCTLGEFVRRQLSGESLDGCASGAVLAPEHVPSDEAELGGAGAAESRTNSAGGRLPGLFARIDELPATSWVNGRPDLRGRTEILVFVLAPDAPDFARLRACLEHAEDGRARYEASGGLVIGVSDARFWRSKKGSPRDRLVDWLEQQRLQLPVAFEEKEEIALDPAVPELVNVTVVIDASGEIVEIERCAFEGARRR